MEMQYFCEDCKVPICPDCGMFGDKVQAFLSHSIEAIKLLTSQKYIKQTKQKF